MTMLINTNETLPNGAVLVRDENGTITGTVEIVSPSSRSGHQTMSQITDEQVEAVVNEARDIVDAWCVRYVDGMPPATARDKLITGILALRAADEDETYEIGKRDGYEQAVQEIDQRTGGDGEYRFCTDGDPERHTPTPQHMIARIVERFAALSTPPVGAETVEPPFEFDRYVNGQLMAEGVTVERQPTLEKAMQVAARIAAKGPNGETPVLIFASPQPPTQAGVREITGKDLLHAIIEMPHSINGREITLRRDDRKAGNATSQLHAILDAALAPAKGAGE